MSDIQTDLIKTVPSIVPSSVPAMSDDECLVRLAQAVENHDSEYLDEGGEADRAARCYHRINRIPSPNCREERRGARGRSPRNRHVAFWRSLYQR